MIFRCEDEVGRKRERESGREGGREGHKARKTKRESAVRAPGSRGEVGKDYGASTAMTERAVIAVPI